MTISNHVLEKYLSKAVSIETSDAVYKGAFVAIGDKFIHLVPTYVPYRVKFDEQILRKKIITDIGISININSIESITEVLEKYGPFPKYTPRVFDPPPRRS